MRRHVGETGEGNVGFGQLFAALALSDGNHITGFALVASNVEDAAVHGHVAMVNKLASTWDGRAKSKAETDVIEPVLQQFQQVGSCGSILSTSFLHVAHKLPFGNPVIESELLFFFETDCVFGALATGLAVLTGGMGPLCGLPGETREVSQAPRDPQARAAVSRHKEVKRESIATPIRHAG